MRAIRRQPKEGLIVNQRYQVEELVGFGECGEVYACRDLAGDKSRIVIKILSVMSADGAAPEGLCRDLTLMRRLQHPNLMRILDFGVIENSGELFLIEERVQGEDVYSATRGMEVEGVVALFMDMLKGLWYLHARGMVHGNLKPANALLLGNEDGKRLKLLDFNLRTHTDGIHGHRASGSLPYAAPEVLMGRAPDGCADIYTLGILMYQALARRLPFEDEDAGFLIQKQLYGSVDLRPLERLRKGRGVAQLLHRLLEKDPAKRIASMGEVIALMESLMNPEASGIAGKELDCHFSAARFVGREKEMGVLRACAERVRESGRGWTVYVSGEAGCGKSRCMEELRSWALLTGWRVLEGACGACEKSAYEPYRQVLTLANSRQGGRLFCFDNLPRIAESDPFEASYGFAAGQFQDLLTRELVGRLADRPTILLLHDFHRADKATCAVLDYLSSDIQAHPILVCVSLRTGEASRDMLGRVIELSVRNGRGETLALEPLSQECIQTMIAGMTGNSALQETLGTWMFRAVGGNPFFLEEMLKHLADLGILTQKSGQWSFAVHRLTGLEVPASVSMVLKKRLDGVSPQARNLAGWLSLFHRAVTGTLLGMVMDRGNRGMGESLAELTRRQMVRIETTTAEETIDFSHELIAEVIRESLPISQSRTMHRRIAEVLAGEHADGSHLHEVAMHYVEGKPDAQSVKYALASAAQSRAEFSHENAWRCYQHALQFKTGLNNEERCTTAIAASDSMFALGMARQAIPLLQSAMRASPSIPPELRARMYMQLALSYQYLGDLRMQAICCQNGLKILQRYSVAEPNMIRAMLWAQLAFRAVIQSRPRQGLKCLDRALQACPAENAVALKGRIQSLYASLNRVACNLHDALIYAKKAVQVLDCSEESYLSSSAHSTLGFIQMGLGRFKSSICSHKRAVFLSEQSRSVILKSQALANLAECLCRMGRIQEALNALDVAAQSVEESNNPTIRNAYRAILAEVKLAAGDYREASRVIESLGRDKGRNLTLFTTGHAHYVAAELSFYLGNFAEASRSIAKLRASATVEAPFYEHELAEALAARIMVEQGAPQKALDHLRIMDARVADKRWPYQRCIIQMHMGEVLRIQSQWEEAGRHARKALRLAQAMHAIPLICRARLLLGLIRSPLRHMGPESPWHAPAAVSGELSDAADQTMRDLIYCCEQKDPPCPMETLWRAQAELSFLCHLRGDGAGCWDYAQKAYENLCKLEEHIPSDMRASFYGVFGRSAAKLELVRLIEFGRNHPLLEHRSAFEKLEDANARILRRISAAVNGEPEMLPLLEIVLDQLIQATGMDRAFVFLRQEASANMEAAKGRTAARENVLADKGIPREVLELVYAGASPIISADARRDPRLRDRISGLDGLGRLFCAPLKAGGRTIGVLYADHDDPAESIPEPVIDLFAAICSLAAIAIDNILSRRNGESVLPNAEGAKEQIPERFPELIGRSPSLMALKDRIGLAANSPIDILITGESGTGKELVARAICRTGRRRQGKFIAVDCGSLSDSLAEAELFGYRKGAFTGATENRQGLLEAANGGILFLDEIGNMPLRLQAKFLRVLQEREVRRIGETITRKLDIQIIAATNKDLMEETRNGRFRNDLLYRLKAMEIRVCSLRERSEDIPLLMDYFLKNTAEAEGGIRKRFAPGAMELLQNYSYPGNIRELNNVVAAAYYSTAGVVIESHMLPPEILREQDVPEHSEDLAHQLYREILEGKGNFEDSVKKPYLQRRFGSSVVRGIIQKALKDAGGSYRNALTRLRVPGRLYASTMQFLKRHQCYLDFRPFRI